MNVQQPLSLDVVRDAAERFEEPVELGPRHANVAAELTGAEARHAELLVDLSRAFCSTVSRITG